MPARNGLFSMAQYSDTLFKNTNLESAGSGGTFFADCDLRHAIGLSEGIHHAPSTVGIDTIFQSRVTIFPTISFAKPEVPKNLIEAIPAPSAIRGSFLHASSHIPQKINNYPKNITAKTTTFALKFGKYQEK